MECKDPIFYRRYKNSEVSPEELTQFLIRNYNVYELASELADRLMEENLFVQNKIVLSPRQEQMIRLMLSKITRPLNVNKGRKPVNQATIDKRNPDESM